MTLTDDIAARLEAKDEIIGLLQEYCLFADRNDCIRLAECFTEDCIADYGPGMGPVRRGRKARQEDAETSLALFTATSHHLSNFVFDFEGDDTAVTSCKLYACHRPVAGGQDWEMWAEYHDRVVRTADGWQIAERRFVLCGERNFPAEWGFIQAERLP
jgi:hypothetical protein